MIESLVSFRRGWSSTEERGNKVFGNVLWNARRIQESLSPWPIGSTDMYETAYSIKQKPLEAGASDATASNCLNVRRRPSKQTGFAMASRRLCEGIVRDLREQDWDSQVWKNFRRKVDRICRNTVAT